MTLPADDAPADVAPADDTGGAPCHNFFDLIEIVSAQHRYAIADARSLRIERDMLRDAIDGLLAVMGKLGVSAEEVARWRKLAGLPEAPP